MKFLITAGPTREAIDPVRYLSNRSSGKMGYAIAAEAARANHEVTLVTGPVAISPPDGIIVCQVESAQQMYEAVCARIADADVAIMTAAVADYRPVRIADQKIKKNTDNMILEMERTPDILGSTRAEFHFRGMLVGFAAETANIAEYAKQKLERKGCDMIVANDVSKPGIGFNSDDNAVTVYFAGNQQPVEIDKTSKQEIASKLVQLIETYQKHLR